MLSKIPFPIKKSETVQVKVVNPTARQYRFSDNETTLIDKKFIGLIVHTDALVKTFDGDDIIPNAIAKKSFLTLADKDNRQMVKRIPMETFFNTNGIFFMELDKLEIDLRKSFIELQDTTGLAANMAWVITLFYE